MADDLLAGASPAHVSLRKATAADLEQIFEIANSLTLTTGSVNGSQSDYLISGFTLKEYTSFLERGARVDLVEIRKVKIVAFMLTYCSQSGLVDKSIRQMIYADRYRIVKQIAVRRERQKSGFGSLLYDSLNSSELIGAAILLDPPNLTSIRFHERHSFNFIGEFMEDDNRARGLWVRNPYSNAAK